MKRRERGAKSSGGRVAPPCLVGEQFSPQAGSLERYRRCLLYTAYCAPMAVERASGRTSLIDVLDRVLDKGIVIDAWVRVSFVGIDLFTPSRGGRAVARAV